MKFAKELERDAVPEWRIKYLNYKAGKKYVKGVARAINRANATPRSAIRRTPSLFPPQRTASHDRISRQLDSASSRGPLHSPTQAILMRNGREDDALTGERNNLQYGSFGSFVATPPGSPPADDEDANRNFELPAPAIHPGPESPEPTRPSDTLKKNFTRRVMQGRSSVTGAPAPAGLDTTSHSNNTLPKSSTLGSLSTRPASQLRRVFSHSPGQRFRETRSSPGLQGFDLVREREHEFYDFMDSELEKVESFYKLKEEQAGQRLTLLREQLHEMRNRRIQEMAEEIRTQDSQRPRQHVPEPKHDKSNGWVQPLKAKIFPPGPNSKALQNMPRTPHMRSQPTMAESGRDYIRRPEDQDVSYRTAKRKLKLAMQEFYRGLELLKSYALLNRTAFRKINKKFDKAANARPPLRYMNEKVNKAWFVNSDVLDGHIKTVEDLYARYFERGNHKLAVGKLRSLARKPTDESGSSFLNGFLIGTGIVFTIQGAIYGSQLLFDDDATVRAHTSYLLQLYGGYFLMLLIFSYFCINCFVWTRTKVNYAFIFEFDQRSHIDWRRLAEFPSFFLLLFGVVMWANFSRYGADWLYLYYPVLLIGITVCVIVLPPPVLAHKSRRWFLYAHWRLLLAGFYPVEFRDFFLGDIYCSLSYAMSNIELFFCLYGNHWENPTQCNSNHSRALGFLTTLPPIWRFLQCLRRYRDTRNIFPHLVNGGKYIMTIMSSLTLSLYRINGTRTNLALFITFSVINGFYTSIWDLFMDFSLLQAQSRHFLLRDILALKRRWPYYFVMVLDPILRFTWIFYAIFTHNTQHSTIVSFLISLMEVTRRGIWALFRVENEHCANVSQYKASRDVPLPYRMEPLMDRASAESSPVLLTGDRRRAGSSAAEQGFTTSSSTAVASTLGTLRKRADSTSARTFSKILAEAHKQDFEKRRKPIDPAAEEEEEHHDHSDDDDDDDDDDEDADGELNDLLDQTEAERLRRRDDDDRV